MAREDPNIKSVNPDYYDAAAAQIEPRPFPSPVNDPAWLKFAVDWFSQAETVMEVGPGRGEFAESLVRRGGPKRYYLVDMSKGMLDLFRERIEKLSNDLELAFIQADMDSDPLTRIPDGSVDRIIMINAFQDAKPYSALRTFRRIISSEGFFRANVISREFQDECFGKEEHFNKETGNFYLTRSSLDIKPLGYLTDKNGDRMPYYRIMRSYYREDLDRIFKECGFEILSSDPIILPKEVLVRARVKSWNRSAPKQEILSKYGGYPTSIDVIARPI